MFPYFTGEEEQLEQFNVIEKPEATVVDKEENLEQFEAIEKPVVDEEE